jgi:hypothetical protein
MVIFAALAFGSVGCTPTIPTYPGGAANGWVVLGRLPGFPDTRFPDSLPAGRQVITDAASWSAFFSAATKNRSPSPAVPDIDFSKRVVLATTMGRQITTGYGIQIASARTGDEGVVAVAVLQTIPGRSCGVDNFVTAPADAVTIPRAVGSTVEFHVVQQEIDCRSLFFLRGR